MRTNQKPKLTELLTRDIVGYFNASLGEEWAEEGMLAWVKAHSPEEESEQLEHIAKESPERIHRMAANIAVLESSKLASFLEHCKRAIFYHEAEQQDT